MFQNKLVKSDGTIIGSESILSCEYSESVNRNKNLTVGNTIAACLSVEIRGNSNFLSQGELFQYYQIEDGLEKKIGVFYVDKTTIASRFSYKVTAYNSLSKTEMVFSKWLRDNQAVFPITVRSLLIAACEYCNVEFETESFANSDISVNAFYADGITCRQIIGWIAEIAGKNVISNQSGKLEFAWYSRREDIIVSCQDDPGSKRQIKYFQDGLNYENYYTQEPHRIQIRQRDDDIGVIYPEDADGNCFTIQGNYILSNCSTDDARIVAKYLYSQLSNVSYVPSKISVPKTYEIRAGDIIDIVDINGNKISTYIMKMTVNANGTSIESTGDQSFESLAQVASQKYSNTRGKLMLLRTDVDGLYAKNEDLEGKYASISLDVDGINTEVSKQAKELDDIRTSVTTIQQSAEGISIQVQKIIDDGVSKVNTGLGLTIDESCVNIHREGSEMSNSLDENGMYIIRSKGTANETSMLRADANGVEATDLTARNYLIIGHARFETYKNGVGCFYV